MFTNRFPYYLFLVPLLFVGSFLSWPTATTSSSNRIVQKPDSSRFSYQKLVAGLDEPMQMAILPNYDIIIAERKGAVRYYNQESGKVKLLTHFNVFSGIEDGLLGVALDPDFATNNWIYFYYAVGGNESISQLTRYTMNGDEIDLNSKKVLITIPTQREYCCHSAGHLVFDKDGYLYLSIGDNTNAEEIEGHNPTDERPGRHLSDGQASTANTNDYRGKILRIKPTPEGGYTVPDGNLFPKDGSQGKPEIYVMGVRNPFRISIDPKTKYLYWGDVGPDTQVKAEEGNLSYDEINQARKPGFFGYPYFLGANEAFPKYDFATKQEGPAQDPNNPINNSPNNTGIKNLPPAQPAFIWYGKGPSKRWPLVGKGGASAMAGPVYYSDEYKDAPYKLPTYYDGKLFIYDWVRRWILAVTMDEQGNYKAMEPFLPHLKVVAPIDFQIAPDGAIYLLAYGTNWFAPNTDAGIIRVEYAEGNRRPLANLQLDKEVGAVPLTVKMSAKGSKDFDEGDKLTYQWKINNQTLKGDSISFTFRKAGIYDVLLTVSDQHGAQAKASRQVRVGNAPPVVQVKSPENKSFYWDKDTFPYTISITDLEDKPVDPKKIKTSFTYLDFGKDLASVLSAGNHDLKYASTEKLYGTLDCPACHSKTEKSIGPSLQQVGIRYKDKSDAVPFLVKKIIEGGSGSWGSYPMPPHPTLSEQHATEIATYILSLGKENENIPLKGKYDLTQHIGKGKEGAYVLYASYTDKGARGIAPITATDYVALRDPMIQFEDYEEGNVGVVPGTANTGYISYITSLQNGKYVRFNKIDLTQIKGIRFKVQVHGQGGTIEVRTGSKTGKIVGQVTIPNGNAASQLEGWQEFVASITPTTGFHDLFFVMKNETAKGNLFQLDWMRFEK